MRYKLYWGLGIFIVLLIGAFTFVIVNEVEKNKQLEADLAEAQKKLEAHNKAENTPTVVEISDVKPPDEPGFKWVRHGDHWDKVPVAQSVVPHQTPASEEIALETAVLKSDLPDELPANFPTDAELQKMNSMDILHLIILYKKEIKTLRKTDYDASVRLSHAVMPKLAERRAELVEEGNALIEESNRRSRDSAGFYPATEGVPAKIVTVIPAEDVKPEDFGLESWTDDYESEGGKQ